MAIGIRRLGESDRTEEFDCGDESLNRYLHLHAWQNQQKSSIGVTYIAVEESASQMPLGYFTLANASATWSSSDSSILTVADDGTINGVALGTAQVVVTYGGFSATNPVTGERITNAGMVRHKSRIRFETGMLFSLIPSGIEPFYQRNPNPRNIVSYND